MDRDILDLARAKRAVNERVMASGRPLDEVGAEAAPDAASVAAALSKALEGMGSRGEERRIRHRGAAERARRRLERRGEGIVKLGTPRPGTTIAPRHLAKRAEPRTAPLPRSAPDRRGDSALPRLTEPERREAAARARRRAPADGREVPRAGTIRAPPP